MIVMDEKKSDFIVVGGVAAGPKTAATLARRMPDAKITLFQKEKLVSYGTCGMPYFASGDIESFRKLTETSYGVPRDAAFFKSTKGFDVITGAEVIEIDRENKSVSVKMVDSGETEVHNYGKLVLATGASPVKAPFPVADSSKISAFTRPDDAIVFRKAAQQGQVGKAVIVGGGFIGCELAESCGGLWGIETILIEKENQILPYVLDPEMASIAEREMKRQDIDVRTNVAVERIDLDDEENPVVVLTDGQRITCDYVFLCLGVRPNVDLAEKCGLKIGGCGGIRVDSYMRTSDPDIFAGGDCVELYHQITGSHLLMPMGSLANRHGRVIAENLAGNPVEFKGVVGSFFVKIFDVNVGSVGLNEKVADDLEFRVESVWGAFPDKPDYYPEFETFSLKMTYASDDGRLLGLQAVGKGDICRRIDVFSSFLQRRGSVNDLLDFEQGYAPPYSEAIDPLHQMASIALAKERGLQFIGPAGAFPSDAVYLDVRENVEAEADPWSPTGSGDVINIPLGELRDRLGELSRDRKTVLICRRGPRSYQAALILKKSGFNNVFVIGGGTTAALS